VTTTKKQGYINDLFTMIASKTMTTK